LSGTGYLVKSATNTWVFRQITQATGRTVVTNPTGVAGNTVVDLKDGIVTPGTYGSSTQYPKITVDTYGRVTGVVLQTYTNNWGSQVVSHDSTLTGDGTSGTPLGLAQQGATTGQVLKWNGTAWVPASVAAVGDNWGTQVVEHDDTLQGDGAATPLRVNNVIKIKGEEYNTGGPSAHSLSHTFTVSDIEATYVGTPSLENCLVIYGIVTAEITTQDNSGANQALTVLFEGVQVYKVSIPFIDHEGVVIGEFVITQDETDASKFFVKGLNEETDSAVECQVSLPTYGTITSATFTNPEIEIQVDPDLECTVGLTLTVHRKALGMYQTQ
jgi:hypothetical protein